MACRVALFVTIVEDQTILHAIARPTRVSSATTVANLVTWLETVTAIQTTANHATDVMNKAISLVIVHLKMEEKRFFTTATSSNTTYTTTTLYR